MLDYIVYSNSSSLVYYLLGALFYGGGMSSLCNVVCEVEIPQG